MWQDYALASVQLVMTAGIIPMIFQKEKPTLWTSIPTAIGCVVISFTVGTLGLWLSMTSAAIAGFLWSVLVVQRIKAPP